ncbi:MAG: methylated-DNA--[protein]-cysteine S-methyltransferase [Candidatus Solibacter usitatus]|nr:methylated-DNA--[protein]-cysteine S-methyltransferase [Candidatus Solibacter usitatus]
MDAVYYTFAPSPVGDLLLAGTHGELRLISFPKGHKKIDPHPEWVRDAAPFLEVQRQLNSYFAGTLRDFDLPLAPRGSPFQMQVWKELRRIPYGATISYGELARRIGNPAASRAVGLANGSNPIPVIIPCHRVIGSNGKLTGFGGGLDVKRALLDLEQGGRLF